MESISKGKEAVENGDLVSALEFFTDSIAEAFVARSSIHLKLNRPNDALDDANEALKVKPDFENAVFNKGISLFNLQKYKCSLECFKKGRKMFEKSEKNYETWIRKCELEIRGDDNEEIKPSNDKVDLKTEQSKFQFYQTANKIFITIFEKNQKEIETKIDLKPLTVKISNSEKIFFDHRLYSEIDPTQSYLKFYSQKIECILHKKMPINWPSVEKKVKEKVESISSSDNIEKSKIVNPYSSNKDWEKLEKTYIKEELESEKPQGEAALNELFKNIYKDANEDTRRAMVKSFQTSGGTVLSTNWDEVKEKDYEEEKEAPSGMEWRTYEGDKLKSNKNDK
mmetsp:Transcript_4395/g.6207  ORF Transcript_4395/g.6207 Transcript_4395/m.6207 type:complete len:339 (+) Transcript_4395:14-1030(+)